MGHRLSLTTRTQISVFKSPFSSAGTFCRFVCRAELFCSRCQTRVFPIHSLKKRFQLLCRRRNQRQLHATTTSTCNSSRKLGPKARTWLSKFFFRITRFTRHWVLMACIKQQTAAWPGVQVPDLCGLMAMQAIHTVALWFDPPTVPPGQANGNDINEDVHEIMQQKHTFSTVVAVHVVIC